jgi:DNA polymerase I-like protein with 3'-5' exonuclease and polymerase domains
MLAGYLQTNESVIMKLSCVKWHQEAKALGLPFWQVNDVHDEWQTETLQEFSETLGKIQADSIEWAGRELGCYCPLAGAYSIGNNWYSTH